jgi:hypothetical protein
MAEVARQAEHRGQLRDRLLLHLRRGGAAVERVVVGVQQHGRRVRRPRDRHGRLEHLPGVVRVRIGVHVLQPIGELVQGRALGVAAGVVVLEQRAERQQGGGALAQAGVLALQLLELLALAS